MTDSYWQATAVAVPHSAPMSGDISTDTLVVGGGFAGFNAALELAENGREVVVIDAQELGSGASGRAGGFVSSRFRIAADNIRRHHGEAMLGKLRAINSAAVEQVQHNVLRYQLGAAQLKKYGVITGALNDRHLKRLLGASAAGGADHARLNRREVADLTGSERFVGGTLSKTTLGIHPLNYLIGLAEATRNAGVAFFPQTRANRIIEDTAGVVVETDRELIRAKKVILATNAYSRLSPATRALAQGVVPFRSAAIATEKLGEDMLRHVLPGGQMLVDTRRLLRWYRLLDGRLIVGGRGAGSPRDDAASYDRLRRFMLELFPDLNGLGIERSWSGYVGITLDGLPHVGFVSDRVIIAGGCNGNGIAMASLLGRYAARYALGQNPDIGIIDAAHMRRIPLHGYSAPAVRLAARWYQFLDGAGW